MRIVNVHTFVGVAVFFAGMLYEGHTHYSATASPADWAVSVIVAVTALAVLGVIEHFVRKP